MMVFVVIDARGYLIGVFAEEEAANLASEAHNYFCQIISTQVQ